MISNRGESPQDRVLTDRAGAEPRYRIAGVEPHGWSTILVEDQAGRYFLVTPTTARLSELPASEAHALLARRDYRAWNGDRAWAPFDRLPLVAALNRRAPLASDAPEPEAAYSGD